MWIPHTWEYFLSYATDKPGCEACKYDDGKFMHVGGIHGQNAQPFFLIHHSSTHQLFETIGRLITSTRDHLNIAEALFRMDWAGEPAAVEVDRHATSL